MASGSLSENRCFLVLFEIYSEEWGKIIENKENVKD